MFESFKNSWGKSPKSTLFGIIGALALLWAPMLSPLLDGDPEIIMRACFPTILRIKSA